MPNDQRKQKILRRRGTPWLLRLIRIKFQVLQVIAPKLAVRQAYKLWFLTRRFNAPAREERWATGSNKETFQTSVGAVQIYRWGEGPLVLLVHGWNGRGLQLGAFVEPLVERGYQVVTVDLPGHGNSEGSNTNIFRISQALIELTRHYGSPQAIIAHSFGATSTAYAINHGLQTKRFISISAPLSSTWLLEIFCRAIRVNQNTLAGIKQLMERRFVKDVLDDISGDKNFSKLTIPGLVIHDRDDSDVPWHHAESLAQAWKHATLYLTKGLGHRRILYNKEVTQRVADFITQDSEKLRQIAGK